MPFVVRIGVAGVMTEANEKDGCCSAIATNKNPKRNIFALKKQQKCCSFTDLLK